MQAAIIGSAVGSGTETSLLASHWDLRRKMAIERLRNTKPGYYSSGPRHFHHTPRMAPQQRTSSVRIAESSVARFGRPVCIVDSQLHKRSFLAPITVLPLFRRRKFVAQGDAAAVDMPLYGRCLEAQHHSSTAAKAKDSGVSIKRIVAFSLVAVVAFSFLYWFSNGVGTSVPNQTVQFKEAFFFSLRSFHGDSSSDLAPVNSLGRLLYCMEYVVGLVTMLVASIVVSKRLARA